MHLPVIIQGVRGNGTSYELKGTMPFSALGISNVFVNQALSEAEKIRKIKSETLKQFADHRYEGGRLVAKESGREMARSQGVRRDTTRHRMWMCRDVCTAQHQLGVC